MSFAKECKALFSSKCFYEILGLCKDGKVKPAEIKKAYYKASLLYHPDRCEKNHEESATKKFQALSKIYSVLSDKEKRAIYDETGEIDDETLNDNENDKDWIAYWRLLFKKVTVEDIKKFEEKYKNSEEERDDLKQSYLKFKGDFTKILENIFCSTLDDEDRLKNIISEMIENENLPKYKTFTNESKKKQAARKRKAENEAKEAEEMLSKITNGSTKNLDEKELENMIVSRAKDRESFLDQLAAKYETKGKNKTKIGGDKKSKTAKKN